MHIMNKKNVVAAFEQFKQYSIQQETGKNIIDSRVSLRNKTETTLTLYRLFSNFDKHFNCSNSKIITVSFIFVSFKTKH
jgi:hypothetical protein